MEAIILACGAGGPQLKRNPLGGMPTPEETFKWGMLTAECGRELSQRLDLPFPFVDCEVIPPLDGSAEDMFIWFIVEDRTDVPGFREQGLEFTTTQLREALLRRGYPSDALVSLRSDVTSMDDINAGGGRFYYFR